MKKRIVSLLTAALLLLSAVNPCAFAGTAVTTVHIDSEEALKKLSADCALMEYSRYLNVILDCDIALTEPFDPIPSFSGIFDGSGHTVSGFLPVAENSHLGLFRYLQKEGRIMGLHVEGTVSGGETRSEIGGIVGTCRGYITDCSFTGSVTGKDHVGGITGENYGTVTGCSCSGSVSGKRYTGGIAGYNEGMLSACTNRSEVNTGISAGGLELDSLGIDALTNLNLTAAWDESVISDTGGIVGYSIGVTEDSVNYGRIGYPHYGYNVGGVAGRQSGYMLHCENHGTVYGRKDVAGIVGQMEPYLVLKHSSSLTDEINLLRYMLNGTLANLGSSAAQVRLAVENLRGVAADAITAQYDFIDDPLPSYIPFPFPSPEPSPEVSPLPEPSPEVSPQPEPPAETVPPPVEEPPVEAAPPAEAAPESGGLARGIFRENSVHMGPVSHSRPAVSGNMDNGTPFYIIDSLTEHDKQTLQQSYDDMAAGLDYLTYAVSSSGDSMRVDMNSLGAQTAKVLTMMSSALSGQPDLEVFEDISSREPDGRTLGKVRLCTNYGSIEGDTDVGGIAGDMGIELEFDLENKLMSAVNDLSITSSTYESTCISSDNINHGVITGKKSNVGGIAGQQQVGLISRCEGYGRLSSTEAGYVGGIAGSSLSIIDRCYAMCELDGSEYIGGIAGSAGTMRSCAGMVDIQRSVACCGSLAGWADMSEYLAADSSFGTIPAKSGDNIIGNIYTGNGPAAIDGISYGGRAEKVDYETLLEHKGLPECFSTLCLKFEADGEIVGEVSFAYGEAIDEALIPDVPEKEGFDGEWEDFDRLNPCFGATVHALYTPSQAALAVENTRGDSPQVIILAEGDFHKGAKLHLAPYSGEDLPAEYGKTLEKWVLRIENSGASGVYSVHFLVPTSQLSPENCDIYALCDGQWQKLSTRVNGSYLVFDWDEDVLVFSVLEKPAAEKLSPLWYGFGGALIAGAAIFLLLRKRKKKASAGTGPADAAV